MNLKSLTNKISELILAHLLTFSLVYALTSSLGLPYPVFRIFLLCMLFIIALFVMFINKKTSIAAFILTGTSLFALIIYVFFVASIEKAGIFLDDYFYWLGQYIQYSDVPDPRYQIITVLALCILLSIFCYLFVVRRFNFFVIVPFGMLLFSIQWSYNIISTIVPFYMFLAGTLIAYIRHIYQSKSATGPNEYAKPLTLAAWSLPVCILIILLAFSIQASDKPIEWKWLDQKVISAYNYFKKNFDYETFDYFSLSASSGFGDRSNLLGGRVKLDKTNVLSVTTRSRVYLKGVSKDYYTGNRWINSVDELTPIGSDYTFMYNDYDEMVNCMELLSESDQFIEDYFEVNPVKVSYLNIKTKSLFLPQKANKFVPSEGNFSGFINNTGDYSSSQRHTKGFSYTVNMYSPKIGTDEFAEVMRKSKKNLYSEYLLRQEFSDYYEAASIVDSDQINILNVEPNDDETDTYTSDKTILVKVVDREKLEVIQKLTKLKEKSSQIYDTYLQLPEDLPQRVHDLSASLVASSENNYDKAKAIEQYLASNFPYNLDVRSTPRNRDFVDYFLFDQKEGYCSYYASAMTILARCAGLPARYVEGYMLPPDPVKDKNDTFVVTNMQAHAWVEIYFEGYGWLPFEPTSPFRSDFYTNDISEAILSSSYNPSYTDYMEMMERYANQYKSSSNPDYIEVKKEASTTFIILISFSGVLILFGLILLLNIMISRFKLYKLISLPAKDCILKFYEYYEKVLSLQSLGLQPSETPFQYSARIDSQMFFSPVKFKVITDIFVKCRYSLEEPTDKEKQLICDFRPGFLSEMKTSMGKLKYFIYKYLINKM